MDNILEAAHTLVDTHGDAFTIEELAEAAGVSRSTIYRRHGGRDGVLGKLAELGVAVGTSGSARDRLLEAVREIVGVEGRLDATTDEIADRAGVSAMSLFRIFGDKASLLQAFVAEVTPRRVTLPTLASAEQPMSAALERVAVATLTFARQNPGLVRIGFTSRRDHEALFNLQAQQGSTRDALIAFFERRIEAGEIDAGSATEAAGYFAAMLVGEALIVPAMGDSQDVDTAARRVVDRFLRAFEARND